MVNYLILDTETSGLPDCYGLKFSEFPEYTDLPKYNDSRLVQVCYILCDSSLEPIKDIEDIVIDAGIDIKNHRFHGITNEISKTHGVSFSDFAAKFLEVLRITDVIIAHNIKFDANVLKSEFYRHSFFDIIGLMDTKKFVCTMNYTRQIVGIPSKSGIGFKNPSLKELYLFVTGETLENHHTCSHDTINLFRIVKGLHETDRFRVY